MADRAGHIPANPASGRTRPAKSLRRLPRHVLSVREVERHGDSGH